MPFFCPKLVWHKKTIYPSHKSIEIFLDEVETTIFKGKNLIGGSGSKFLAPI